eukprot:gene1146-1886_t
MTNTSANFPASYKEVTKDNEAQLFDNPFLSMFVQQNKNLDGPGPHWSPGTQWRSIA